MSRQDLWSVTYGEDEPAACVYLWSVTYGEDEPAACVCWTREDAQKVADTWNAANRSRYGYQVDRLPLINPIGEPKMVLSLSQSLLFGKPTDRAPYESETIGWGDWCTWSWEPNISEKFPGGWLCVEGTNPERVRAEFAFQRDRLVAEGKTKP